MAGRGVVVAILLASAIAGCSSSTTGNASSSSVALAQRLDAAGLCRQTGPLQNAPPTVVGGETLSGAWLCITHKNPRHGIATWSEDSPGQAHQVADYMARKLRSLCRQMKRRNTSSGVVRSSPIPIVEGDTWLAVPENMRAAR